MVVLSPLFILSLFFTLIHHSISAVDFIKLPLHQVSPDRTPSQALSYDNHRLSCLHRKIPQLPIISGADNGTGQYFVNLRLGTPPQNFQLVADTGSDLVWVKCSACRDCSSHTPNTGLYVRHSSTYSAYSCVDSECQLVPAPANSQCNQTGLHSQCTYEYSYEDSSYTRGLFSSETASFDSSSGQLLKHNNLAFGCAFQLSGPSVTGPGLNGASGVIGLGRGPISLPSQLGFRFGNKFSYCLKDYTLSPTPTSYLFIGGTDAVTVNKSYTPLLNNSVMPTFYYIGIESVYVENEKLQVSPSVWRIDDTGNGGTIVDSGTTLTFLAEQAYTQILRAFIKRVNLPAPIDPSPVFELCYNVSGVSKPKFPRLSFQLLGGALLSLPSENYFIDTAENVKCLALQPVMAPPGYNAMSVLGNLFQQGFLFEFDTDRSRLGFTRHGCAIP